jgi:hypothetical protein
MLQRSVAEQAGRQGRLWKVKNLAAQLIVPQQAPVAELHGLLLILLCHTLRTTSEW